MAGPSWLVDSKRIATKIKTASSGYDPQKVNWMSNPSRACPKCNHHIDNSDVTQEWPGLPCGVKFDPSDQEIIWHLLAKVGNGNVKPHPIIEEFIPTVNEEDGICYTHPQNLPGVKQDGSVSHFFHRAIKAYNTGTRKRRKIHGDSLGDVRWHKTGRTKPVIIDGIQMGCKKIMVLYMSMTKTGKPEKTNWVMHQYHLGTGEDENDGEFVVSKIFYQQQVKLSERIENGLPCEITEGIITKVDPVTPKSVIRGRPCKERWQSDVDLGQECEPCVAEISAQSFEELPMEGILGVNNNYSTEHQENHVTVDQENAVEDLKLRECESQYPFESQEFDLLDTQQLIEGLSMADGLFWSQPSNGEGDGEERKNIPCLSVYTHLGVDAFKNDLEECQNLAVSDLPNSSGRRMLKPHVSDNGEGAEYQKQDLEFQNTSQLDPSNTPDIRLSQLEFDSQDSFFAWAGSKLSD